ncbi:MYXO-CTERM sorting domain-containing protein [Lujinxingia vulgaris]|nr:MYXO-CTERM sorting domain-containing protein [Lujinxingia vulgaris]
MMNSKKWALALLGATALGTVPTGEAEARDPRQSQYVQSTEAAALGDALISDNGATITAGIDVCRKQIEADAQVKFSFTTTYASDPAVGSAEQFFEGPYIYELSRGANDAVNCREDEAPDCQTLDEDALTLVDGVAEVEVALRELVGFSNAELCETEATDMEHFVQLHILTDLSNLETGADYTEGRVIMDLIRPEAPALDSEAYATATTMRLTLELSEDDEDDLSYYAVVSAEPFEAGQLDEVPARGDGISFTVNPATGEGEVAVNLEEGTVAYVAVAARDEAGNYSLLSNDIEVEVLETEDFWDYYVDAGGAETGGYGCASTGGSSTSLWTLLVATMVLGVGRRRRRQSDDDARCA